MHTQWQPKTGWYTGQPNNDGVRKDFVVDRTSTECILNHAKRNKCRRVGKNQFGFEERKENINNHIYERYLPVLFILTDDTIHTDASTSGFSFSNVSNR